MTTYTAFPFEAKKPSEMPYGTAMSPLALVTATTPGGLTRRFSFRDLVATAYSGEGPRPRKTAGYFGVVSSTSIDQTTAIQTACTNALGEGVDLFWEPGVYIRTGGITSQVSWFGADNRLVEHRNNGALGVGGLIQMTASNLTVNKIRFTTPLTPSGALNDAVEGDGVLRFASVTDAEVSECVFVNSYGGCVLFRSVNRGLMAYNKVLGCFKDAFHITALSKSIDRLYNYVESGGDDAFPVVGYVGGGSPGAPEGIRDIGNRALGVKKGRAFAYVGATRVTNIGSYVDGVHPSSYARSSLDHSCCALYIASEVSFNTFGNNDIEVSDFTATNVGRGAAPFTSLLSAIHLEGRTAQPSRNIRINGLSVSNCASQGVFANGGGDGGMDDLSLTNVLINNTVDPAGYLSGAAQFVGAQFQNVRNLKFQGSIANTGGGGIVTTNNCAGEVDIDVKLKALNRGNKTGSCRGVQLADGATTVDRFKLKALFEEQESVLVSGSVGFLDYPVLILSNARGRVDMVEITYGRGVTTMNANSLTVPDAAITVTGSPFVYTNSSSNTVLVTVNTNGATITDISRGRSGLLGSTGKLYGLFNLRPNEVLQVTYSAGTPAMRLQQIEGI